MARIRPFEARPDKLVHHLFTSAVPDQFEILHNSVLTLESLSLHQIPKLRLKKSSSPLTLVHSHRVHCAPSRLWRYEKCDAADRSTWSVMVTWLV
jgi:hypothetical protein